MQRHRLSILLFVALSTVACVASGAPSGSPAPTATTPDSSAAPTPAATPGASNEPTPSPTAAITFRALDLPADYHRGTAEAVDGTTAVGWVQVGQADEQPAIWDTTTGAIRVLPVPDDFVHPNGDTFVRLVGVSGTTAVGTGVLGAKGIRGQTRAMAWDTETGDLRILDIPADFTQVEAHAVSGTTAVGQAWTAQGERGAPVAWDTTTGAVRILQTPADWLCVDPHAIDGDTIVGTRCLGDAGRPIIWASAAAEARDLDLLPGTDDGVPLALDGATAVGSCCFGEEGTPLPLAWDTATGAVRQLALPAPFVYGRASGVSGSIAVGTAVATPVVWDLTTGEPQVLPSPPGYDEEVALHAVRGRTVVGMACEPPPTSADDQRCVAAAWTLP